MQQIRIAATISSLALYHYWGCALALYRDYIARSSRNIRVTVNQFPVYQTYLIQGSNPPQKKTQKKPPKNTD